MLTLHKHLLAGTWLVIFYYNTFKNATTFFLIRNWTLAKNKKTIILHTNWVNPGFY